MSPRSGAQGILVLALLVAPAASRAGVPNPNASSVEHNVVGNSSGAAMGGGFSVTVRDVSSNTLAGKVIELILPAGVRPYTTQAPGATASCGANSISKASNAFGVVIFQPRFGGYTNVDDVQVFSEGVLLAQVRARSTDLNANGATEIGDFNHFRLNFLLSPGNLETDYDESGLTDVADFNLFRMIYLNDVPGTVCP